MTHRGLLFLALCIVAHCVLTASGSGLHHTDDDVSSHSHPLPLRTTLPVRGSWHIADKPVDPSTLHILRFALRQHGIKELEAYVESVSNPQSSTYGKYLSLHEVASYVAPPKADVARFRRILLRAGALEVNVTESQDFAYVRLSVEVIGRLFQHTATNSPVELYEHRHVASGRRVLRTKQGAKIHLIHELDTLVELVTGLGDFFEFPTEQIAIRDAVKAHRKNNHKKQKRASSHKSAAPATAVAAANPFSRTVPDPAVCASSSPDLIITGGHENVAIRGFIYCKNGQPTSNTTSPCAEHPPIATQFSVTLTPVGHPDVRTFSYPMSTLRKVISSGNLIAVFPGMDVLPYEVLNVTAQVTYADGTLSAVGVYGAGVYAATPFLTPQFVQKHYNVPVGTNGIMKSNSQATLAFEEIFLGLDDLDLFQSVNAQKSVHPNIYGWNDPDNPGAESALDIQWIMGVAPGVNTTFMQISGDGPEGSKGPAKPPGDGAFLLEWAMQVNNMKHPPLVTSISYGDTELGYYNKFGNWSYVNRLDVELLKMAARGLTVITASGDGGVANVGMYGNDISDATHTCTPFLPHYPSSSRYVTAVGGTFITNLASPLCDAHHLLRPELPIICDQLGEAGISVRAGQTWTSGGGFSNRTNNGYGWWQQDVVKQYLAANDATLPPSAVWNRVGRAYPDVAVLGTNFLTYWFGTLRSFGGTSASAPVFAGLISLINDYRLREGQSPLGFLNPFLYLSASLEGGAFRDVTVGQNNDGQLPSNKCSLDDPSMCPYGFTASYGWDPVTGLGSPNWEILKHLALEFGAKTTHHQESARQEPL